jgi:hypothetical protein
MHAERSAPVIFLGDPRGEQVAVEDADQPARLWVPLAN